MPYDSNQLEKLLLILSLGLTEAIKASAISIDESEKLLYSPVVLKRLKRMTVSDDVVDLLHLGTELEDVESLLPKRLSFHLDQMSSVALKKLKTLPKLSSGCEKWYDKLMPHDVGVD